MFPSHFFQTLIDFLSVCTVTGAASVSVAARTCHLTLLATSWNIQQESFAQVPPNNTAPGAAPAARIPGRVAVPIQDENGDDGGRWQGGGKLVCSSALQSDGRHTSNNRENSINQNRT